MWKLLAKFAFAETAGPSLNKVGEAIGNRLARIVDPIGARMEEMSVMAMYAQVFGTKEFEPEPTPKKKPRKK